MAELSAFAAVRYDFARLGGDLSDRVAPPYDVLEQADKDRLLGRSPENIVAVDLPHIPPKSAGPPQAYAAAANTLRQWMERGVMVREPAPAIYAYHQAFEHEGHHYTRRMFLARLRLEPFEGGNVLAHEETFGGPKEDRLALMKATFAHLSPVFALYRDPEGTVGEILEPHTTSSPDAVGTMDSVDNRLWIVRDESAIQRLVAAFADKKVYIADGHHRYTTALNFRDWLAGERGEPLSPQDPANYVMIAFASMDDPGSLILPTHRVVVGLDDLPIDELLAAWEEGCAPVGAADEADLTLVHGASDTVRHVRFTNRPVLRRLEPGKSDAWCELDVAYLHRYLIDELFTPTLGGGGPPTLRYLKTEGGARSTATEEHGIALICKPVTMAQLRAVSEAGDRMPQKSTYFYPKVATGLTLHELR